MRRRLPEDQDQGQGKAGREAAASGERTWSAAKWVTDWETSQNRQQGPFPGPSYWGRTICHSGPACFIHPLAVLLGPRAKVTGLADDRPPVSWNALCAWSMAQWLHGDKHGPAVPAAVAYTVHRRERSLRFAGQETPRRWGPEFIGDSFQRNTSEIFNKVGDGWSHSSVHPSSHSRQW